MASTKPGDKTRGDMGKAQMNQYDESGKGGVGKGHGGKVAKTQQGQYKEGNSMGSGSAAFGTAKAGMAIKKMLPGDAYDGEDTSSGWGNSSTKPTDMGKNHPLPKSANTRDAQTMKSESACTSLGTDKAVKGGGNKFAR